MKRPCGVPGCRGFAVTWVAPHDVLVCVDHQGDLAAAEAAAAHKRELRGECPTCGAVGYPPNLWGGCSACPTVEGVEALAEV